MIPKYRCIRLMLESDWVNDTKTPYVLGYGPYSEEIKIDLNEYCQTNRVRVVSIFNDGQGIYPYALVEEVLDSPLNLI